MAELLEVRDLVMHFVLPRRLLTRQPPEVVRAVDGISFSIARGETLSLVGESGCGKSTAGRTILRLLDSTSGSIRLKGTEITRFGRGPMRAVRRTMQVVFQDPYSSLNPRMTAGDIVAEPLKNYGLEHGREVVSELFRQVGLRPEYITKYPHEFSGGQRQRLAIARALSLKPELIVADEPVSALDVSVQAQIINLLQDLQERFALSYLFISHDLAIVEHISHRVAVMYIGKLVELADKRSLFLRPQHPYTEALIGAVPVPDPRQRRRHQILAGDPPSPSNPPSGCRFHSRCPLAEERCRSVEPELREVFSNHWVACHLRQPS